MSHGMMASDGSYNVTVVGGGSGGGAVTIADGAAVTLGAKADAKSSATDATAVTFMSVLKQVSFSIQAAAASLVTLVAGIIAAGPTASGASVTANPLTTGGRASTTNPTAVADGQVVNTMVTKHGKIVIIDGAPRELKGSQKATLSNTTAETTIITAGAAGVFNDLYGLILANTGATTTKVDIRDATGGSIIATIEVPTLDTRGFTVSAGSTLSQTTAANNWTAQCAAATTAMEVTALFVKTT